MARITVEDALKEEKNRFALAMLAAQRVRQLFKGSKPLSEKTSNREVVTSLREIAEGKVKYAHPEYFPFQLPVRRDFNIVPVAGVIIILEKPLLLIQCLHLLIEK